VTLRLRRTPVSAKTALELVLEPLGLTYVVRDGLVFVTSGDQANEIEVYEVRDLQECQTANPQIEEGGGPKTNLPSTALEGSGANSDPMAPVPFTMGGLGAGAACVARTYRASSLAEVVVATIEPSSWNEASGSGSIVEYNGLLIVDNKRSVHERLRKLLQMMRASTISEF
jgi:hypothetical protein